MPALPNPTRTRHDRSTYMRQMSVLVIASCSARFECHVCISLAFETLGDISDGLTGGPVLVAHEYIVQLPDCAAVV